MSEQNHVQRTIPLLGRLYLWATRRLYNEFAWSYDLVAWVVSGGRWDRWRRMALDYVVDQPVLEIGFGTGELLLEMARRGWQARGVDLSPAMQRVTGRKMRRRGLFAPRAQASAQSLPFPRDSFGTIVSTFPAEYVIDPASLQEFWRVLRPGGRLVIAGLVVYRSSAAWNEASGLLFGNAPAHPVEQQQDRLASAGFETRLVVRNDPPWQVPVIIAKKPA
ncbi:MAG: methyltransferase domain-containing protein [Anaerolineae bacterium]|nr:methyltransferase domain-containing protein [Anaerolineae bacterium]MCB0203594.1 methyltransferase domain-containing protein [Anaerolineae bacterium]